MLFFVQNSPMFKPAQQYLTLRSFGAPAVIISMAIQGVFRGIKDTKTPLYATGTPCQSLHCISISIQFIMMIVDQC